MRKWKTEIEAIDPQTGELKKWSGPIIEAPSAELAQEYCTDSGAGLGYCKVLGEMLAVGSEFNEDGLPNWDTAEHFDEGVKN